MESEVKIILAFLFKRSGKIALTESELYLPLSMELGWFTAKEAQELVQFALIKDLVREKEGILHPNFEVEQVSIPVGFTPSKKKFMKDSEEQKEKDVVDQILSDVSQHTHRESTNLFKEMMQLATEKQILPEVAALLIARTHGLILDEYFDLVEKMIFKGNTK